MPMASSQITWQAPEFEYRPKDSSWYWMTIIVMAIFVGAAVWQKNFIFGFFLVLAEILILAWGMRKPHLVDFSLNKDHFVIGEGHRILNIKDIAGFSLEPTEDSDWVELKFASPHKFRSTLKVLAPATKMDIIRETLGSLLPETEPEHSLLDDLQRFIGF